MLLIIIQYHSIYHLPFTIIQYTTCHSTSFTILQVIQYPSIFYMSFIVNQYSTCHSLSISVIQHLVSSTQFLWVPQHSEVFWSPSINTVVHSKAWPFPIPHETSWSFNTSSLIRYFILLSFKQYIQTRFMCSIVILVPLNHSNSIKSFNIVSFPYSLTHSIFLAFIRLVSFNILHKCNSISFTNCVSFTIVPYTMCQLLSFNVLSYSKRFIQTCYFKNISIIHFHSTYYHSQSSSFNILFQECFNHSIAHLSFNVSSIIQYYHSIITHNSVMYHSKYQPFNFH